MLSPELDSFVKFCRTVREKPDGIFTSCQSASDARKLRRRFYHLREQLTGEDAVVAGALTIKVVGRLVHVMPKLPSTLPDWDSLATGEPANDDQRLPQDH